MARWLIDCHMGFINNMEKSGYLRVSAGMCVPGILAGEKRHMFHYHVLDTMSCDIITCYGIPRDICKVSLASTGG